MDKKRCEICKKLGHKEKSCYFRTSYKNKKKDNITTTNGKSFTKTWKDGKLEITKATCSKKTSSKNCEKEEEIVFIKEVSTESTPTTTTSTLSASSSISVRTINIAPNTKSRDHNEIAMCNITDHQMLEKRIRMLKAENTFLKVETNELKKLYVQEYTKAIKPSISSSSLGNKHLKKFSGGGSVQYTPQYSQKKYPDSRVAIQNGTLPAEEMDFGPSIATENNIEKFLRDA